MRKLLVTAAASAAMLLAGSLAWQADAATFKNTARLSTAAATLNSVESTACWGWGACRPGWHRVCNWRGRCWCARC